MKPIALTLILLTLSSSVFANARNKTNRGSQKTLASETSEDDSSSANADKIPTKRTHSGKKIVKLKTNEILEDSSDANRQDKTISLTVELVGFAPFPVRGAGIGYYLTPDNILELSYSSGETDFLFTRVSNSMSSLHLKTFWGNSFYTNLGVASRMFGYRFDFTEVDADGNFTSRNSSFGLQNKVLGADFTIGNRWQWDTFTIGCDWIGAFVPFATTGSTEVISKNYSPEDIQDANEAMDRFGKQGSIQFLRFYLGVSF